MRTDVPAVVAGRHWHVGQNIPGYLPEGDVYGARTRRDAVAMLRDMVRSAREDGYVGRPRCADLDAWMDGPRGSFAGLGLHLWAVECSEGLSCDLVCSACGAWVGEGGEERTCWHLCCEGRGVSCG